MHETFLDGHRATADDLRALAMVNYGHFTSMQMRSRAVRGLDLHLKRLREATRELFDAPLEDARIREAVTAACDDADVDDASVRITVFSRGFDYAHADRVVPVDVMVSLSPPRGVDGKPAWVKSYPFRRPSAHIKHVGTFPLFRHRRQALRDGFDDALFVDDRGHVSEGSLWNIGFWDGGQVVWPQADALRGTAERLLQVGLAEAGIAQCHEPVPLRAVAGFEGAFALNATGMRPLAGIDDTAFRADPALFQRLQAALDAVPPQPIAG